MDKKIKKYIEEIENNARISAKLENQLDDISSILIVHGMSEEKANGIAKAILYSHGDITYSEIFSLYKNIQRMKKRDLVVHIILGIYILLELLILH